MKTQSIVGLLSLILFTSCGISSYDNYDSPESKLEGRLVYGEDPIRVSYNNVTFELWQPGFGSMTPINVTVDQDGSYSSLLFDGDYKLVFPQGQGPFMTKIDPETGSDTIFVQVRGQQTLDIEVTPYYMIRNPEFSVSGITVSASLELEQIITDTDAKDVEYAALYISKTSYVDTRTSIVTQTIAGTDITDMNDINLSVDVPEMTPTQDYVFARVGVKIANVEDMIFSHVEKMQLD